ncbi:MAG: hypothetical protein KF754_13285 [Planctomycetes bacterium]|nr:hypothetical protein [Planctomycetota bacterium]
MAKKDPPPAPVPNEGRIEPLNSRVLRDRIEVAGRLFETRNGTLVVIDGQGETSQHRFESTAQRESDFEADLLRYLRAQKLLPTIE